MTKPLDQMSPLEVYEAVQGSGSHLVTYNAGEKSRWLACVITRTGFTFVAIPIYRPRPEWMP